MFKRFILVVLPLLAMAMPLRAQLPPKEVRSGVEMVKLTDKISLPTLGVENQSQSGTCWSFGVTAVLESDIMAKGGKADNLSDMWIVRNIYFDKVVKYVRLHGKNGLSIGGAMHDVMECIKRYGVVPEEAYSGLEYGEKEHNFAEIDAVIKAYADAIVSTGQPSAVWERGLNVLLDNYFGARIATFEWQGKSYTPMSYAKSLGLNMDDYVSVTSFTHHPYNKFVALELPDNWLWEKAYNIPIEELMGIMDSVLDSGRSFGLAVDITENGFHTFSGVAMVASTPELKESDWGYIQRRRQFSFDRYITTDDHCLQIMGRAVDKDGNIFYKAKNSWGIIGPYNGFFYLSKEYVALKTILIMVDRNLLPSNIKKNLGVK